MIESVTVKIKIPDELSSAYIENELKKMGLDVLRWAVTDYDREYYTIDAAVLIEEIDNEI